MHGNYNSSISWLGLVAFFACSGFQRCYDLCFSVIRLLLCESERLNKDLFMFLCSHHSSHQQRVRCIHIWCNKTQIAVDIKLSVQYYRHLLFFCGKHHYWLVPLSMYELPVIDVKQTVVPASDSKIWNWHFLLECCSSDRSMIICFE